MLMPLSLFTGSVAISAGEVMRTLAGNGTEESLAYFIIMESRLPQMLTAMLAGASLSAGGLVMQTLFSNPLADPSLLGVSGGASLGTAISLLLLGGVLGVGGVSLAGAWVTVGAAFAGACAVIALLAFLSTWLRGNLALLIAGVMISFAINAMISLLSFYATADGVHSFIIWGMGDFGGVPMSRMPFFVTLTLFPAGVLLCMARQLNALLLGPDYAANLGVRVKRARTCLLLLTGLLTASVTAMCGPISFIGLAVPHMARMVLRTADHRRLLPAVMLLGADVALLALIVSHLPGGRGTLPLSAITPALGVPVVVLILLRRH